MRWYSWRQTIGDHCTPLGWRYQDRRYCQLSCAFECIHVQKRRRRPIKRSRDGFSTSHLLGFPPLRLVGNAEGQSWNDVMHRSPNLVRVPSRAEKGRNARIQLIQATGCDGQDGGRRRQKGRAPGFCQRRRRASRRDVPLRSLAADDSCFERRPFALLSSFDLYIFLGRGPARLSLSSLSSRYILHSDTIPSKAPTHSTQAVESKSVQHGIREQRRDTHRHLELIFGLSFRDHRRSTSATVVAK